MITKDQVVFTAHQAIDMVPMDIEKANIDLQYGTSFLAMIGLHYWLSAGTVLGIYRDKALIPHDTDLDVGVLLDWNNTDNLTVMARIISVARNLGYTLLASTMVGSRPMQLAFVTANGIVFDIYFFYKNHEEFFVVNFNSFGVMRKPERFVNNLEIIEYNNVKYPAPAPIEEYLKYRFGEDWKTPKKGKDSWFKDAARLELWKE